MKKVNPLMFFHLPLLIFMAYHTVTYIIHPPPEFNYHFWTNHSVWEHGLARGVAWSIMGLFLGVYWRIASSLHNRSYAMCNPLIRMLIFFIGGFIAGIGNYQIAGIPLTKAEEGTMLGLKIPFTLIIGFFVLVVADYVRINTSTDTFDVSKSKEDKK